MRAHRAIPRCELHLGRGPELPLQHPVGVPRGPPASGGSNGVTGWAIENGDLASNREEVSGQNRACVFRDALAVTAQLFSESLASFCPCVGDSGGDGEGPEAGELASVCWVGGLGLLCPASELSAGGLGRLCWGGGDAPFVPVGGLSALGLARGLTVGLGDLCREGMLG